MRAHFLAYFLKFQGSMAAQNNYEWALFLSTDVSLSPLRILDLYALRWAIEVYFKETK